MEPHVLHRQIDDILLGGRGETRSVIVQMVMPDHDRDVLGRSAVRALRQRTLALTARDCLPAQVDVPQQAAATPRPHLHADRDAAVGSLSAQVVAEDIEDGVEDVRAQTIERLRPLLEHAVVRRARDRAEEDAGDDNARALWAAGAVNLELPPDDLRRLVDEIEGIDGIYPNRTVRVPPVVRARNVPQEVLENRASSWGVERVGALATWGAYGARGAGTTVGVLDSGVDARHPDLAGKITAFAEFDAAGRITGTAEHDDVGHGTHVCGTIAGGNTGGQWVGVAPEARLAVAKVLGLEGGTDAQILAGMTWAIERRVDVLNMSISGLVLGPQTPPVYTTALLTALRYGIPTVVAIGNEGSQTTGLPGNDLYALSVGAIDHLDRAAGFSGGRTQVIDESPFIDPESLPLPYSKPELCAPGVAITSTVPGGTWAAVNGTSMAAPHVAGVVALLLSATSVRTAVRPHERGFLILDLVVGSVDELGEAGQDHRFGFGRVNALTAVGFARERGYAP
jgi:subtilisin family serine protease